jgi:hypothetical protein
MAFMNLEELAMLYLIRLFVLSMEDSSLLNIF